MLCLVPDVLTSHPGPRTRRRASSTRSPSSTTTSTSAPTAYKWDHFTCSISTQSLTCWHSCVSVWWSWVQFSMSWPKQPKKLSIGGGRDITLVSLWWRFSLVVFSFRESIILVLLCAKNFFVVRPLVGKVSNGWSNNEQKRNGFRLGMAKYSTALL